MPGEQVAYDEQFANASLGVDGLRRLEHRHPVKRQPGICPDLGQSLEEFWAGLSGEFREDKSGQNRPRRTDFLDQGLDLIGVPDPHEQQRPAGTTAFPFRRMQLGELFSDVPLRGRDVGIPDRVLEAEHGRGHAPFDQRADPLRVVPCRPRAVERGAERHGERPALAVPVKRQRRVGEQRLVLTCRQVSEVPHLRSASSGD